MSNVTNIDYLGSLEGAALTGGSSLARAYHAFLCGTLGIKSESIAVCIIPQIGDGAGKLFFSPNKNRILTILGHNNDTSLDTDDLLTTEPVSLKDSGNSEKYLKSPISKGFNQPIGAVFYIHQQTEIVDISRFIVAVDTATFIVRSVKIQRAFELLNENLDIVSINTLDASRKIINNAQEAIGCRDIGLWRVKDASSLRSVVTTRPYFADMNVGEGIAGKCVATGEEYIISDLQDDECTKTINKNGTKHKELVKMMGWHAAFFIPLSLDRFSAGVVAVYSGRKSGLNDLDYTIAKAFASQIEYAYTLSETDRVVKLESHLTRIAPVMDAAIDAVGNLHDAIDELFDARNTLLHVEDDLRSAAQLKNVQSTLGNIKAAKDLMLVFRDSIKFSRLVKLRRKNVNLHECFSPVVERTLANSITKAIDIKLSCKSNLEFKLDSTRICRAIRNLFENAIYFLNQIKISNKLITLKVDLTADNNLEIMVEDNGPGIPHEEKDQIYDIFYTTKDEEGFGLGLAMVKLTVDAHGGEILLESHMGKRSFTKFTILLPFAN